jgi:hypothetical protein
MELKNIASVLGFHALILLPSYGYLPISILLQIGVSFRLLSVD